MFQFILIDDESYMLEELAQMMDWESLGFELAATFTDGASAAGYIAAHDVDLILSDIKMPGMSGIELAKLCYEKYPETLLVLISGFREFEYAREAMQYGVRNYLLKPVSYTELQNIMKEMYHILEIRKPKASFEDNELACRRQELFLELLDSIPVDNLDQRMYELELFVNCHEFPCQILEIYLQSYSNSISELWKYGAEGFQMAVRQILPGADPNAYYVLLSATMRKIEVLVISHCAEGCTENHIQKFIKELKDNLSALFHLEAEGRVRDTYPNIKSIAPKELSEKQVIRHSRVFAAYLLEGKYQEAKVFLEKIWSGYKEQTRFQKIFCEQVADALSVPVGQDYEYLMQLVEERKGAQADGETDARNLVIDRVLGYVNEHYGEDISLEEVAAYIGFNANYFSTYFKQQTGEKFIDFLIGFRMERAKELFAEDMNITVQEVCDLVGYKSMPYFYKLFRAYTGYTPAQYREQGVRGALRKDEGTNGNKK